MPALISGQYDLALVALSVVIAIFASYTALKLADRTTASHGKARAVWMTFGAVVMGVGIWSMHYIGMLAFSLPIPVFYDLPTVAVSLLAAVFASCIALFVVSRERLTLARLAMGSVVMGAGIFAMHYVGMAAMRLSAQCFYSLPFVTLSGIIAVGVSGAALLITFQIRRRTEYQGWMTAAGALVMGLAIASMHYTGMAAVCFRHSGSLHLSNHAVSISSFGITGISTATFLILLLTVAAAFADKYFALQKNVLELTQTENTLFKQNSLVCVFRTTLDGRFLEVNEQALKTLGYARAEDMIGISISHHYWYAEDGERVANALEQDGIVNGLEICLRRTDNTPVWVIYSMALCPSIEGGEAEVMANAMDISATKKTQQDLRLAKEQAEAANHAKGQFLANMSHELRTPLNGILGMTTLALQCELSSEVREYLEDSKMSTDALMHIINNVLDFSKIDAQKLELENRRFSLKSVLQDTIRTVAVSAEQKQIRLLSDLSVALPEFVTGDSGRLRQVLLNLLGNAIKFTDQGQVSLTAETTALQDHMVKLHVTVEDTGIGIAPEDLDAIFGAFAQADISNTRRYGGTGLGLAISSQLTKAMGGELWVESTVGRGSAFHFVVDLRTVPEAPEANDAAFVPVVQFAQLGRPTSASAQ